MIMLDFVSTHWVQRWSSNTNINTLSSADCASEVQPALLKPIPGPTALLRSVWCMWSVWCMQWQNLDSSHRPRPDVTLKHLCPKMFRRCTACYLTFHCFSSYYDKLVNLIQWVWPGTDCLYDPNLSQAFFCLISSAPGKLTCCLAVPLRAEALLTVSMMLYSRYCKPVPWTNFCSFNSRESPQARVKYYS